jgi:hypothetical protein
MNDQIKSVLKFLAASGLALGIGFVGTKLGSPDFGKDVCDRVKQEAPVAAPAGK